MMLASVRVALVTGSLKLGGTTTFLCNFGGELVRRGIGVHVLSFERENALASDFARLNIPTFGLDERKLIFEDRMEAVLRRLSEFKPSVVVANLSPTSFEILRYVPHGVFRVGTAQSDDPSVYRTVRSYAAHMDLVAAVSKRIHETLTGMPDLNELPVTYLPYGVPMPKQKVPTKFDDGAPIRILYLGRLDQEQKRVRLFPEIFGFLNSAGIPFHWTIAGEGQEKAFLEESMKGSSPTQTVSFPGKVEYGRVPELISEHDIFLLTSDYEGLPLSLLEAMGNGLVPVVSDLPSGVREVVNDKTGFRVALTDVCGYADAIIWLHRNRTSSRRFSEQARESVQSDFSTQVMVNRWLETFPAPFANPIAWPFEWDIKPPLVAENLFRFSPAGRFLRRLKFAARRPMLR